MVEKKTYFGDHLILCPVVRKMPNTALYMPAEIYVSVPFQTSQFRFPFNGGDNTFVSLNGTVFAEFKVGSLLFC